jgi:hypothetical protein
MGSMNLKLRRYFKLPVLLAVVASLLILGIGDQRIAAYPLQTSGPALAQSISRGAQAALQLTAVVSSIQVMH